MASCVRNTRTKNYQNLILAFQVTVENVGDVFWNTVYCYTLCLEKTPTHALMFSFISSRKMFNLLWNFQGKFRRK